MYILHEQININSIYMSTNWAAMKIAAGLEVMAGIQASTGLMYKVLHWKGQLEIVLN